MEFTSEWFDESSKAWLKNKRKIHDCMYKYKCQKVISKSGKVCGRDVYKVEEFCRSHWAKNQNVS